ncbi:MAG: TIGR03564 family F420-dependent LLM class oxidoreductase [Acidimicrobiales bacterium]
MDVGIFGSANTIDGLREDVARAHEAGFESYWTPQVFGLDALTAFAVVAASVPDIRLATAVIPTYPRHPMMLAQQALTANQATGGRIELGIGLSHQPVVEAMWGYSFDRPLAHMRDYLTILQALLSEGEISHAGESVTSRGAITISAEHPPVLVAALGPKMLELTGELADGTITWMTGPTTIAEHTRPTINAGAAAGDRPEPRVVTAVPTCITDDVDAVTDQAETDFGFYASLPSYRAMLEREGLDKASGLALVGSFDQVAEGLERYVDAGATTVVASVFGPSDDRRRTVSELSALL